MRKNSKKLIEAILSSFMLVLSAACSSPPDSAYFTENTSISTKSYAETSEETTTVSPAAKDTETTTAASISTEKTAKTEKSSVTTSETVTETESAPETEPKTEAPVTVLISETETPAPETSATTTVSATPSTAAETSTKAETTPAFSTTVSETTTSTTAAKTEETTTAAAANPEANSQALSLSNPNASPEAQRLYNYISDTYRKGIISGQQESTWMGSEQYEFDYIFDKTGKYPAIRGLDYMNDDFDGVNRRAVEWHERGGIVTICWHCGSDFGGSWSECMNTELTDWNKALTEGTAEYNTLIAGMDKAAKALKELRDKNIPVLWRPFHELDGGWFWWGKGGAENFKKLWIIMYDRYTNYWELNNLIWICGFSGNGADYGKWYPGDDYADIAGADSYNDGANAKLYRLVCNVAGDKMPICFHECGRIPTVEQLKEEKADWVWFMTWHTDFITGGNDANDLKKIYNDPYVITLDELPDWQ